MAHKLCLVMLTLLLLCHYSRAARTLAESPAPQPSAAASANSTDLTTVPADSSATATDPGIPDISAIPDLNIDIPDINLPTVASTQLLPSLPRIPFVTYIPDMKFPTIPFFRSP